MIRIILIVIVLVAASIGVGYYVINHKTPVFESVCDSTNPKYSKEYCQHVGKRAHSLQRLSALNERDFGKIIGVAWRTKGSVISPPHQQKRLSTSNSYYYIVQQDGSDYVFLRLVNETEPK